MTKLAIFLSLSSLSILMAAIVPDDNKEHGRGYLPPEKNMQIDEKSKQYFNRIMRARTSIPKSYSAVDEGLVSPVRNQHGCGSCVAFATIAVIESCYKKETGIFGDYSEQELVDCGYWKYGAGGCWGSSTYSYAVWVDAENRQLTHESNYPYKGNFSTYTCPRNLKPYNLGAKVTGHYYDPFGTEEELKRLVFQNGAVIVSLHANNINFGRYTGGIFDGCDPEGRLDHAVAVVGYGTEDGVDYWLIKNSWGVDWGEKGFMKLKRGVKMCRIGEEIITITCEKDGTPTDAPLTTEPPEQCPDRWINCPELSETSCYKEWVSRHCRKSCGLCEGMTPHPSNTCSDKFGKCPKLAETRCYKKWVSTDCRKSCGKCKGMTPHPSNTCYDKSGKCPKLAKTKCFKKWVSTKCGKSCGLCEGAKPHPSNTCYDKLGNCPKLAETKCSKKWVSSKCRKSCGLCEGVTPHLTRPILSGLMKR